MTLIDKFIPTYTRFVYGFSVISVVIGLVSFGMALITMITVKGIYIPTWMIVIVAGLLILLCTVTGYVFEKYSIWDRITSHQNQKANPEVRQILQEVREIKKIIDKKE